MLDGCNRGRKDEQDEVWYSLSATTSGSATAISILESQQYQTSPNIPMSLYCLRPYHNGTFEIFASGGAWNVLFGKPLLQAFGAIHEYTTDTITLHSNDSEPAIIIQNENPDEQRLTKLL